MQGEKKKCSLKFIIKKKKVWPPSCPKPLNTAWSGLVRGLQSGSDGAVNSCEVILIMMRIISVQTGVVEPLRPARLRALLLQLHCS